MLRKGDIIIVHNKWDIIGRIISYVTKSKWHHVAWVLDGKYLLESRSIGIVKTPIRKYLSLKQRWIYECRAIRIKGNPKKEIKKAMDYGLTLQTKYNYFKYIIAIILVGLKKRFNPTKITCSGFIALSLSKVGIKFNSKNPYFISPGDIVESKITEDVSAKELKYF